MTAVKTINRLPLTGGHRSLANRAHAPKRPAIASYGIQARTYSSDFKKWVNLTIPALLRNSLRGLFLGLYRAKVLPSSMTVMNC